MAYAKIIRQYFFNLLVTIRNFILDIPKLKHNVLIFIPIFDFLLSSYYQYGCGLYECTVDLDDQTTMHFWTSRRRRHDRPNLVLVHGCGAEARWQFFLQIRELSKTFNIYIPDLLFFGKSYTKSKERTPRYQAMCVMEGLKRGLGVERCIVYAISYGGWVGHSMAQMYPTIVEKNVIVSSGIGSSVDQKLMRLSIVDKQAEELVVPRDPAAIRLLIKASIYKFDPGKWIPDFIFWEFIKVTEDKNRKEKEELIRCLMSGEPDSKVSALSQETLLVWGDQDNFFPKAIAHQLQRILGPKARLRILKDTGHAVNMDSPKELNELIISFAFGQLD